MWLNSERCYYHPEMDIVTAETLQLHFVGVEHGLPVLARQQTFVPMTITYFFFFFDNCILMGKGMKLLLFKYV